MQGRYAYVGWFYGYSFSYWRYYYFYGWTPRDLTEDGKIMLRRTISWAQCGNVLGCE